MKAMVLHAPNTPFSLDEVPDPKPGPGEAVAKIFSCGSGLTIQHIKAGRMEVEFPRIIGHEITGVIVEIGEGVTELEVGDPVTSYYYLTCGHCKWCRANRETLCENLAGNVGREVDGGYAEYMKLPARTFLKLPEGLDYKTYPAHVGVITDAISTPYKVVRRARIEPPDTVAVFGAGGGVGIHMLMMARWAHAARVIGVDIAADKFDACREAGADDMINPTDGDVIEQLKELTGGRGVDVAIDFVSSKATLEAAAGALGTAGRMVTLGGAGAQFTADAKAMLFSEQDLLGSKYATKQEVMETLEVAARGEVWPLVTEIRPLAEAEAVHDLVEKGEVTGRAALLVAS
jgi:propanol-preferring alcohol dehydrogenase